MGSRELLQRGKALTIAGRTEEATRDLERVFKDAMHSGQGEMAAEALDLLSWISWIELDGPRTRTCADRFLSLKLPKASAEAFRMYIRQATMTLQLGKPRDALRLLDEAENVSQDADIDSFTLYLMVLGDVHAALGGGAAAVHHVKLAVDISRKRRDHYSFWRRLIICAYVLQSVGDLKNASLALDEALRIATATRLTWEVPFTRTRIALVCYLQGNVNRAAEVIASALDDPATNKWMYAQRSFAGVTIALAIADHDLLQRCADERVIEYAFNSADVYTIGPVVAAYHGYFLQMNRPDDAARILQEGMDRIASPDAAWLLLPRVATYGDDRLISRARELFDAFPGDHSVSAAFRLLFDALRAFRRGNRVLSETLAGEAQSAFERTELRIMIPRCVELAGRIGEAQRMYLEMGAVAEATRVGGTRARPGRPRRGYERSCQRREILRLVATGASTKAIADRLGISCRTVKYRVRELYSLQGVASRREFMELLSSGYIPNGSLASPRVPATSTSALLDSQILEDELLAHLTRLGISAQIFGHAPVRGLEDSKVLRGNLPGNRTKNLLLKDQREHFWLVSLLEDTLVDLKEVARLLGSGRLSFANASQLHEFLGVLPGAISPLAAFNDRFNKVRVVLESRTLEMGPLNFHPLRNDATLTISSKDLLTFLADCRHTPTVITLDDRDAFRLGREAKSKQ